MANKLSPTGQWRIGRLPLIVLFALHQVLSTAGVIVLSGFICDALLELIHRAMPSTIEIRASWLLTEVRAYPVQVFFGFAAGLLIARGALSRAAVWVWILPFLFFCFGAIAVVHPEESRLNYLFGDGCKPAEHCFYQLLFTLPLLASAGYTGGAALARFRSRREQVRNIHAAAL